MTRFNAWRRKASIFLPFSAYLIHCSRIAYVFTTNRLRAEMYTYCLLSIKLRTILLLRTPIVWWQRYCNRSNKKINGGAEWMWRRTFSAEKCQPKAMQHSVARSTCNPNRSIGELYFLRHIHSHPFKYSKLGCPKLGFQYTHLFQF